MATKKRRMASVARVDIGATILAAANEHATESVKSRLKAFAATHHRYVDVQRKVDESMQQVEAAQARVTACDADQDAALQGLAGTLATDGQPWANPFAAFGADTLAVLRRLSPADKATAIHRLVVEVKRQGTLSTATRERADAAEEAAQKTEAALVPLGELQAALQSLRTRRDAVAHTWDNAVAALKRGARSAADEGAPGLYDALFGRIIRPTRKKTPPAPEVPPATPPVSTDTSPAG